MMIEAVITIMVVHINNSILIINNGIIIIIIWIISNQIQCVILIHSKISLDIVLRLSLIVLFRPTNNGNGWNNNNYYGQNFNQYNNSRQSHTHSSNSGIWLNSSFAFCSIYFFCLGWGPSRRWLMRFFWYFCLCTWKKERKINHIQ